MNVYAIGALPVYVSGPQAATPAGPANQPSVASSVQLALLQDEQKGGGGGGGHGVKRTALDVISQVSAEVLAKPKPSKTLQERQAEIERMKRQMAEQREQDEGDLTDDRDRRPPS